MAVSELRKRRRIKKKSIKLRSKILPVFTKPEPDTPTAQKACVTTVPPKYREGVVGKGQGLSPFILKIWLHGVTGYLATLSRWRLRVQVPL